MYLKILLICVCALLTLSRANAQELSIVEPTVNSLDDAKQAISFGHHLQAINFLTAHLQNNPEDHAAMVTLAQAYNGLSMHNEALAELADARAAGHDSPELHSAMGQAYLGLELPAKALPHLRQAPQTGDNQLAIAAALIGTGDYSGSVDAADHAEQLNPNLAHKAAMLRSIAMASRGNTDRAHNELDAATSHATQLDQDALYQGLRHDIDTAGRVASAAPRQSKNWGWQATVGWAWNSNTTLRPKNSGTLGPADLADSEDQSVSESVNLWYRLAGDDQSGLIVSALVGGSQNFSESDYNTFTTGGGLLAYHTFDPWRIEGGAAYSFNMVDGEAYGHTASLFGSATLREADWTSTTAGYRVAFREFMFDADIDEDRDGELHTFTLSQNFKFPVFDRPMNFSVFGQAGIENTDGKSTDNNFWAVGVRAEYELMDNIAVYGSYTWRERRYQNENVRVVFAFPRDDDEWQAAAGLMWRVKENMILNAGWSYTDHTSNMPAALDYQQHVVGISLTITGP